MTTPVDFDDRSDPDTPTTAGTAIICACCFVGAPEKAIVEENGGRAVRSSAGEPVKGGKK